MANESKSKTFLENLYNDILYKCKKNYQARCDDNGKLLRTVGNYGLKTMKFLQENKIIEASNNIHIYDYVLKYDIYIVYYMVSKWLEKNDITTPKDYLYQISLSKHNYDKIYDKDMYLQNKINTVSHDPLIGKIKITHIGQNSSKTSVVPQDWINKEFKNGHELHKSIDILEKFLTIK